MAHNVHFPQSAEAQLSNGITYAILAASVALVVALIIADVRAQPETQPDVIQSEIEDWHGNVRRSHQTY